VRVVTANVNGIRAAARRGGLEWLAGQRPDVLCLQEVRATRAQLEQVLEGTPFASWSLSLVESDQRPGHAGVALLSSRTHQLVTGPLDALVAGQGRWVAAQVDDLLVASVYVHTGDATDPDAQGEKEQFLGAIGTWLAAGRDRRALLCGDLNVAHTEWDIKNWKGNVGKAGFLDSERAHLTDWYDPAGLGWVDLVRRQAGPAPGPYTWWSWRGRAFDNDAGWRIDCALASPRLAESVTGVSVGRADSYAARWSDHAPVMVDIP
jgi:exodeoxyribonuclease-3